MALLKPKKKTIKEQIKAATDFKRNNSELVAKAKKKLN